MCVCGMMHTSMCVSVCLYLSVFIRMHTLHVYVYVYLYVYVYYVYAYVYVYAYSWHMSQTNRMLGPQSIKSGNYKSTLSKYFSHPH